MLEHEHPHDPASGRLDWKPDFRPTRLPQTLLLGLIRLYKVLLSPHLPPACRFYPTCSDYGFEAIRKYGALKGGGMAVRRLLRCHPLHPGGYDPVP